MNEPIQKHTRIQLAGKVFIHDEDHLFIAPLNNVSAGGVFVDKLVSLPEGREVRLVIKSTRFSHPVQVTGKVIRVERGKRFGSAVIFSSISSAAKAVIESQVQENQSTGAVQLA